MATYFHHHPHNHNHHGGNSDDGGLQTLILMNPNFVGYSSDHHAPPSFQAHTLYHAPPQLPPQLVGVPYAPQGDPHAPQSYASAWAPALPPERESPRAQQGLSLTLSSHNQPHHQPSPAFDDHRSESPAASTDIISSSKYLKAAQVLLEEVVNVTVDRARPDPSSSKKPKNKEDEPPPAATDLSPSDKQELQTKKEKLITLLDEVEQRHRQYHHQMQAVVASFEQVAGAGSARTYTSLALKTISSQFRGLRGAISGQIKAANKGLGEGEGEGGSRLKFLDHQMRQQRALQQLGMIQNNAWRPQRGLPEKAVSVLRAWLFEHFLHPYPKDSDKIMLAKQTGLTRSQVSNWFINARVRLWKPMIEEMYAEEVKDREQNGSDEKPSKQDQGEEPGSDEKDHNVGEASENHGSSMGISASPASFVGPPKMEGETTQGGLKKPRNNEYLATFPEAPNNNNGYMGGLVSYPIGEIGRFGEGQFPTSFSGNGVSLTLGLESLSVPGNSHQAFLSNNQDIDQYRGRLEMVELNGFGGVKPPNASHPSSAYAAQLLHDFVA